MKKHIIILLFSLFFGFDLKSQAIIIPTITPQPTANINPCYNMGFESTAVGSYSAVQGWTLVTGSYTSSTQSGYCFNYPPDNVVTAVADIVSLPGSYLPCQTTSSSPFPGNKAILLRSDVMSFGLERGERTFSVTAANPFLEYGYVFCLSHSHLNCCEAAYMKIMLLDNLGNAIPCGSISINGSNGTSTACINVLSVNTATSMQFIWTPNWVLNTYDLTPYIGTMVKLKVEVGSCTAGGHHAKILFDAQCSDKLVSSNGTVSGNTITVCQNPNVATLNTYASNSFTWNGPPTSSIVNMSSSSISTSVSGVYSLSIYNPNCGSSNTFTYLVNFCNVATAMNENGENNKILIYPNPSSEKINIKGHKEMELKLIDFSGREIERFTITSSGSYEKVISGLSKGVYFILGNGVKEKVLILEQ